MKPSHHPPDEWLLGHIAGTQSEGLDLLTASHASYCTQCKNRLADLQDIAGQYLSQMPEQSVPGLDALLANLPAQEQPQMPRPSRHGYPAPLERYLGDGDLNWTYVAPGVKKIPLGFSHQQMPVRIIHLAAGLKVPVHNHPGLERTLVLSGGYDDESGTFVRGDIAVADDSQPHHQRIHKDAPCVSLVVADYPITPVGIKSTVLSWFFEA